MITEDDIRGALHQESHDIDVRAALRPPAVPHRRAVPVWAIATTVTVVVVLVLGTTLLATGVGRPAWFGGTVPRNAATVEPAATGRSTGFVPRSRVDVNPLGSLQTSDVEFYPDRQEVWLRMPVASSQPGVGTAAQTVGLVVAWEPGAFDETQAVTGTAVQVEGRTGWFGEQTVQLGPGDTQRGPALVWQYATGAWAVAFGLQPEHRTEAFEQLLAGSVVPRDSTVAVPVRLQAAPAGLLRQQLSISYDLPEDGTSSPARTTFAMAYQAATGPNGPDDYVASVTVLSAAAAAADVATTPDPTTPAPASTDRVPQGSVQLDGRPYDIGLIQYDDRTEVDATARGARVSISIGWQDRVTPALNPAWLQFTAATSLDDPTTWFDGSTAFP